MSRDNERAFVTRSMAWAIKAASIDGPQSALARNSGTLRIRANGCIDASLSVTSSCQKPQRRYTARPCVRAHSRNAGSASMLSYSARGRRNGLQCAKAGANEPYRVVSIDRSTLGSLHGKPFTP